MTHSPSHRYGAMEAISVTPIPEGLGWQYEPTWDGFRCLAFKDGDRIELQSKSSKSLTRCFPEVVEALRRLPSGPWCLMASWSFP